MCRTSSSDSSAKLKNITMWATPQGREGLFSTWRLFVVLVSFLSRLEPLSAVHPGKSVTGTWSKNGVPPPL